MIVSEPSYQAPLLSAYLEIIARLTALEARQEVREAAQPMAPVVLHFSPHLTQSVPVTGIQPQEKEPPVIASEPSNQTPFAYSDPDILERLMALEARQDALEVAGVQSAVPELDYVLPPPTQSAPEENISPASQRLDVPQGESQPQQLAPLNSIQPQVISALPDPDSGKIYNLQVGTFSTLEAADRISRQVSSIGFIVLQEQNESMYRVLAVDIPAVLVHPAIQRLGVIGINQVWVRESTTSP